ncbi:hypothetical protein BH10PLA2_BH10PLA2_31320 [soil metagenome]
MTFDHPEWVLFGDFKDFIISLNDDKYTCVICREAVFNFAETPIFQVVVKCPYLLSIPHFFDWLKSRLSGNKRSCRETVGLYRFAGIGRRSISGISAKWSET